MHSDQPEHDAGFARAKMSILIGLFVAGIGNSFVFAILPPLGRKMGLVEIQIGFIVTISAFVFMFGAPFWGARSERWGRKPIIIMAMTVFCIMTVLFAITVQLFFAGLLSLMATYILMVLFRALFTAGISGMFPSAQAYMADTSTREDRTAAMALVGVALGTGMIAGPAVAAVFAGISLVLPFYIVACMAVGAGALIQFNVTEPRAHAHRIHGEPLRIFDKRILPFMVLSALIMATLSCMQQASGFYFQDLFGLTASQTAQHVGLGLMASAVASVGSQFFIVRRLKWAPRRLLRTGVLFTMTGIAMLLTLKLYPLMVCAMGIFGIGSGMIMPGIIATLSMNVGDHHQGSVAGFNSSAMGLGFMVGPLLGSGLYTVNPLLPYGICLVFLVIMTFNVYALVEFPEATISAIPTPEAEDFSAPE